MSNQNSRTQLTLYDQLNVFAQQVYDYLSPKKDHVYPVVFMPATTAVLFAVFFQMLVWSQDRFNCGYYLTVCSEALTLLPWGGFVPFSTGVEITESYRLFTYSLHHWSFSHILTNLSLFVILAYELEKRYGGFRILFIYVVSAISTGLCFWLFYHDQNEVLQEGSSD